MPFSAKTLPYNRFSLQTQRLSLALPPSPRILDPPLVKASDLRTKLFCSADRCVTESMDPAVPAPHVPCRYYDRYQDICINRTLTCNNVTDCPDESDETSEVCGMAQYLCSHLFKFFFFFEKIFPFTKLTFSRRVFTFIVTNKT